MLWVLSSNGLNIFSPEGYQQRSPTVIILTFILKSAIWFKL